MNIKNTLGKRFLIGLTVLSLSAGLSSTVLAQQAHDPARQQAHAAKMHEKMAQHHAMLHEKLKLSAAQEPAWATFGASMKPGQRPARIDRAALQKMSAPERMEARIAMSKERLSHQETRLSALKTFYATLTPEQQKVFDDNMHGGEHGSGRGHKMRS
jgi:protein CpxP